jgi:putative ABC transport system permease protein
MNGRRPAGRGGWVVITGTGAAASAGLALLVLATVLISMALPRASLGQRTVALHRTLATVPATNTAVTGTLSYATFDVQFGGSSFAADDLSEAGTELASDVAGQGLPLGAAPFWSGLASGYKQVTGAGPRADSALPPQMEILYRDRLSSYSRLSTGKLPAKGIVKDGQVTLEVAVTAATAARYGLRLGSKLGISPNITLKVTGIVAPAKSGSAFWGVDPIAAAPELSSLPPSPAPPYWMGACFIGGGELPLLQDSLPTVPMQVSWAVPVSVTNVSADQVTGMAARLNGLISTGGLLGTVGSSISSQVPLSSGLLPVLAAFTAQDQAIGAVLGLLFVSLGAIGIVAILLAAALLATRRHAEFAVMRARGASLRQVALRALAASAALALPAAAAGAALALVLTPGGETPIAWWLAGAALVAALAGVPLVVVGRLRSGGGGRRRRVHLVAGTGGTSSRRLALVRRLVVEAGLAALAIGGIIVLRRQGLSAGSVDVYASLAPVLVAVLAAIIVVHGYPLLLRLLLRLARGRDGVSAFVGLARATRTAPAAIAVVFALVLALAVVAFGTMIDDAVHRGDVAASWSETGADAVVYTSTSSRALSPAVQREIAAVPGAVRTAPVLVTTGSLASGGPVTVVAVDPARYAALVADTPGPAFPAASLARRAASASAPVPALASAAANGVLPPGGARLTVAGRTLALRPAGRSPGIPGVTAGSFLVLPSWALAGSSAASASPAPPSPSLMLVVGPGLNAGALAATVRRALPGAAVTFRGSALAALADAPLPAAARQAITEGAAAAAGFSALIVLIWLLMSAPARDMTLARLSTMGLGRGQARWLVGIETLPQVLAAIAGGVASACVLAPLVAPSISLAAFTGSATGGGGAAGATIRTELVPLVLCAAGLIVVSALALGAQFLVARWRGVARPLRAGE